MGRPTPAATGAADGTTRIATSSRATAPARTRARSRATTPASAAAARDELLVGGDEPLFAREPVKVQVVCAGVLRSVVRPLVVHSNVPQENADQSFEEGIGRKPLRAIGVR